MTEAERVTTILTGRPLRAMPIPLTSQPPIRRPASPLFKKRRLVPKGNWYTALVTKLLGTSYGLRLRSQARQDWFSTATVSPAPTAVSPAPTDPSVIAFDHLILRLPQETVLEGTGQPDLQRMEITVPCIRFLRDSGELRG